MTLLTPSTARMARRLARGHGRLRWRGRMELGWGGGWCWEGAGEGVAQRGPRVLCLVLMLTGPEGGLTQVAEGSSA